MRPLALLALPVLLAACADDARDGADTGAPDEATPELAPLADLSEGDCPDLSVPGLTTMRSGGLDRTLSVVLPTDPPDGPMPLVILLHGLMSPSYTPQPTEAMVEWLDLQQVADEDGVALLVPLSRTMEWATYTFYMWEIFEQDDLDLVFFDDLRTCAAQRLDVDLDRLVVAGFSGGALFTTVLARERGDTMAAMVEMSGGSDLDSSLFPGPGARYDTPAWPIPTLLWDGGPDDVWPDPSLVVVDFPAATDTLQEHLLDDGHFVVRCGHEAGHTIVGAELSSARTWTLAHAFGEPSPFEAEGLDDLPASCTVPAPGDTLGDTGA